MARIVKAGALLVSAYLVVVLSVNGIAGVVQPELGAGSGEGVLRTFSAGGQVLRAAPGCRR